MITKTDLEVARLEGWEEGFKEAEKLYNGGNSGMCQLCKKVTILSGSYAHIFGVDAVCADCSDEKNYPGRII